MWKVGVRVEVENLVRRGEIRAAIQSVMGENEGQVVGQRMRDLRNAATECTSKGGSSDAALQDLVDLIISS